MRTFLLLLLAANWCPAQEAHPRIFKAGQVSVTLLAVEPGRLMPVVEVGNDVAAERAIVTLYYRQRAVITQGNKAVDLLLSKTSLSPILGPGNAAGGDLVDLSPGQVEFIRVALVHEVEALELREKSEP